MLRVYARTREREKAWKFGAFCLGGSLLLAPFTMLIFQDKPLWGWMEFLWTFSIILESVCILPQLLLLRQTNVPTVLDSYYLLTLGSYRAFYILNWIWRELDDTSFRKPDAVSIIFGCIQTAFYVDFAWVYYSRQRVKLRNGGVVDADDLGRGWILRRIFGAGKEGHIDTEGDEESSPAINGGTGRSLGGKWGTRGISVSADDGVLERERANGDEIGEFEDDDEGGQISGVTRREDGVAARGLGRGIDKDAKMKDPDELARILNDDDDEDEEDEVGRDGELPPAAGSVGNGAEWRDGRH